MDMRRLAGHLLTLGIAVAVWQGGATQSGESGSGQRKTSFFVKPSCTYAQYARLCTRVVT